MLQITFSPNKFNPLQEPGCFKTSSLPLIRLHGHIITKTISPCRKYSINCSSQKNSLFLTNQNKLIITHNENEGIIIRKRNHKPLNKRLSPPLALQDGYYNALQSGDGSSSTTAAAQPAAAAAASFMEVFKKKFNAINHLVRSYTWVNIIAGIVSVSLLPIQCLSDLTPRFFLEILKAIVPTLLMNTFLTALNQICDVEIDKINKPYLPLASGDLSMGTAIAICLGSALLSFTMGTMSGSPPLLCIQIICFLVGCAYSLPLPFLRWKSDTFLAPFSLVILMGFTLQLPFFVHIQQYVLGRPFVITRPLIFTVAIMSIFAFVNGLLKDLPDVEGDKKFGMKTLCVLLGKEKVLPLCVNMMLLGYGGAVIAGASSSFMINKLITIIGHTILSLVLWYQSRKVDVDSFDSTFNFYMLIWKLNYVEYILIHFLR